MHRKLPWLGIILAFACGFWSVAAEAATATTTFQVTANVEVTCTIAATDLDFGTYDRLSPTPLNGTSQITVDCTHGAHWEVGLNQGLWGTSVTTRQMANGSNTTVRLNYGLFEDPAHTINWGNTVGTDTVAGTGAGTADVVTVYGQVPAGQTTATAGGYADTITATITF